MQRLTVNGETHAVDVDPATPLLWVLRDALGLRGTKFGCGVGVCGICTVLVDGALRHACTTSLGEAAGHDVTTVEGLGRDHPVLRAWVAGQVPQCGYCQPGQVMAAAALHAQGAEPDGARAREVMSSVLCRCGTYQRVRDALAAALRGDPGPALPAVTPAPAEADVALDEWIRIAPDGTTTVVVNHAEMGQGVATALATLVAEELGVDLEQMRTVFAPADPRYVNPLFGIQLTGGSTSVRGMWEPLRLAGARARERLVQAAAERWQVDPGECIAAHAVVRHHPTARSLSYGVLAARAAQLPAPERVALKTPDDWQLIGRPLPRLDIPDMVTGRTVYGIDVVVPGMRYASVLRCPILGGRASRVDERAARRVPGVRDVVAIDSGIAVVADDTASALAGREALDVEWVPGAGGRVSDADLRRALEQGLAEPGEIERRDGDAEAVTARAERVVAARYATSHLAHGTLEPMNCTARVTAGRCEVWLGTQSPQDTRATAAQVSGLPEDRVTVYNHHLGGGFGRRGDADMVADAVAVARAVGAPVQVLWTRADDLQHDHFRPAHMADLRAALDDDGRPRTWWQRTAGPGLALDGIEIAYAIRHVLEARVQVDSPVPGGAWRAVGPGQNAFVIEGFVDELAAAAGQDPYAYRRALLVSAPRHQAVLDLAAQQAGWGTPMAAGHGRGIAVYRSFGTWVAQVAEVAVEGERIRVERVVCAIDCGTVVNPDTVVAQVEGAVAMGCSAALKEAVRIEDGQVRQSSFADYPILTYAEMPRVEVHIVPSAEPPGGVGEPGLLPVAPAIANAVFAATGRRLRALPLRL